MGTWKADSEAEAQTVEKKPQMTLVDQKARQADLVSDVGVPVIQAGITGLFAGLIRGLVMGEGDWLAWAISIAAGVWLIQTINFSRLLWAAEQKWQVDINKDGHKGKPVLPPVILNNRRGKYEHPQTSPVNLKPKVLPPTTVHPYEQFVRGCAKIGTDIRKWEEIGISRPKQQEWRDKLIDGGWAEWNSYNVKGEPNETVGWHLTSDPEEILKESDY